MRRLLGGSRYLIVVAVAGSFVAATTLILYGAMEIGTLVLDTFRAGEVSRSGAKTLALAFIEMVDLFLLGTVMYIIALGLHELFIDDGIPLPAWLEIHDLDDLKDKLIGVVIVVLGVLFLGQVVTWDGTRDLLGFGVAIAAVVAALTWFLGPKKRKTPAA